MEIFDVLFKAVIAAGLGVFMWQFLEFKGGVNRFLQNEWPHYAKKVDEALEKLNRHLGEN